jgi:branched-chain amino acid transport system substrate-binding protein
VIFSSNKSTFILAAAAVLFTIVGSGCDGGKSPDSSSSGASAATTAGATPETTASARKESTGAGNKYTSGDIPIGLVASENGDLRPWGVDCEAGAKLAVKEVNDAGGIQGHKVQLLVEDSNSKPEQGKSAAEKLIGEGVLGVIGEVSSGITAAMGASCFEKGVPDVAVGATRTDLTDIGNTMFRVCYTDAFQGPVMANFAYKELGLRKVALMTDKTQPYSTGLSDAFRATFTKLGGIIVDEQFYESKQYDFKAQLTNLKAKDPDGIFASGYFNEVGPMARQVYDEKMNVKMLGGDGWDSSQMLKTGGQGILNTFFCNHYNNLEDRPAVKDFLAKWKASYPSNPVPATTMGALGYDATMVVLNALKASKSLDSKSLRDAIADTENYHGVTGDITLKGNEGNPPKRAIVVEWKPQGQVFAKAYDPSEVVK